MSKQRREIELLGIIHTVTMRFQGEKNPILIFHCKVEAKLASCLASSFAPSCPTEDNLEDIPTLKGKSPGGDTMLIPNK